MGKKKAEFLLLVLVSTSLAADTCNLRCWLGQLVIQPPDVHDKVSALQTIDVRDIIVRNLSVGAVAAMRPAGTDNQVVFDFSDVGAVATMNIASTTLGITVSADVDITVSQTQVHTQITLVTAPDGLPAQVTSTNCNVDLHISSFYAGGSTAGDIINGLKGIVVPILESAVPPMLCDMLSSLFADNVTALAVSWADELRPLVAPLAPPVHAEPPPTARSMHGNAIVDGLQWFLSSSAGVSGVNFFMDRLTNNTGAAGAREFNAVISAFTNETFDILEHLKFHLDIGSLATIDIAFDDFHVAGMNTWNRLDILHPTTRDLCSLDSWTGLSSLNIWASYGVTVTITSAASSSEQALIHTDTESVLYEHGELNLGLSSNQLAATMWSVVDSVWARIINHTQLVDKECFLHIFKNATLDTLFLNTTIENASLVTVAGDLELDMEEAINDALDVLVSLNRFAGPAFVNSYVSSNVLSYVNGETSALVDAGNCNCTQVDLGLPYIVNMPQEIDGIPNNPGVVTPVACAIGAFSAAAVVIAFAFAPALVRKRFRKLPPLAEHSIGFFEGDSSKHGPPCPLCNPQIPALVRIGVVLLVATYATLFISGYLVSGAAIIFELEYWSALAPSAHVVQTDSMGSYHHGHGITTSRKDGAILIMLVLIVATLGPLLSLIEMLLCWCLPARWFNLSMRTYFLGSQDRLCKIGWLDAVMLMVIMVVFHFDVPIPVYNQAAVVQQTHFRIFVVPEYGLLAVLLSQVVHLFIVRIMAMSHNRAILKEYPPKPSPSPGTEKPTSLLARYWRKRTGIWSNKGVGASIVVIISVCLIVCAALLPAELGVPSMGFKIRGAFGVLFESMLDQPATRVFSVSDIVRLAPGCRLGPYTMTLNLFLLVFVVAIIAVPIAHVLLLIAMWVVPLRVRVQRKLLQGSLWLRNIGAIEVLFVVLAVVFRELEYFSQASMPESVAPYNRLLNTYFAADLDGINVVFDAIAFLPASCVVLGIAALLYLLLSVVFTEMLHNELDEFPEIPKHLYFSETRLGRFIARTYRSVFRRSNEGKQVASTSPVPELSRSSSSSAAAAEFTELEILPSSSSSSSTTQQQQLHPPPPSRRLPPPPPPPRTSMPPKLPPRVPSQQQS